MKLLKTITNTIKHSERLATCDQSNKEAYPDQQKDEDKDKDKDKDKDHNNPALFSSLHQLNMFL